MDWGKRLGKEDHTAAWYRDNVIWVDICSKVIPGTPEKALDQDLAAKNKKKRLMSPGSAAASPNLGGSATADKQCSFGDTRVFMFVALTRGVLGVKVFTEEGEFPGETPDGARILVNHLPALLTKMLGAAVTKPRTIFSDRGPGFFHRKVGDNYWRLRNSVPRGWLQTLGRHQLKARPSCSAARHWRRFTSRDCHFLVAPRGGGDTAQDPVGRDAARVGQAFSAMRKTDQQRV